MASEYIRSCNGTDREVEKAERGNVGTRKHKNAGNTSVSFFKSELKFNA